MHSNNISNANSKGTVEDKGNRIIIDLHEQHKKTLEMFFAIKEREQLISEITQKVIDKLTITLDVSKLIQEIDELKKSFESLLSMLSEGVC